MATIASCQGVQQAWLSALAEATGGRTFSSNGYEWVWLPARRSLNLLFPDRVSAQDLHPGLAEASRLGAVSVTAWLNGTVDASPLEALGFVRGPQPWWMAAPVAAPTAWDANGASVESDPPEVSGPDAAELAVARIRPRRAWHITARTNGVLRGRAYAFVPLETELPAGIFNLAVGRNSRRRGLGTALLSAAAAAAQAAGAREVVVNATLPGYELCRARGFELIGRGQTFVLDLPGTPPPPPA